MAKEKVILAYSGGLDTSVLGLWLKETYDYDVIAVCCNAGQKEDFDAVEKKALATGAVKAYTLDIREEFITDYIWPTLKAGAIYEGQYMLGHPWQGLLWLRNWWRSPKKRKPSTSLMAVQVKETTRFVSRPRSRPSILRSRSSRHGDSGISAPGKI